MGSTFSAGYGHISHSKHHVEVARRLLPRGQRWAIGARLCAIVGELAKSRESVYCKGYSAIRRGGTVRTMWVVKRPVMGLRKGQKLLRRSDMLAYEARGATFRTVRFPRDETIRKALRDMAKAMSPLHHASQYGFAPKRNCIQSADLHRYARTVFLLDIQDAFEQVNRYEVEDMLRRVFLLRSATAAIVADMACCDGHLYQGCPIAPVIFNIRAMWAVERLERLCRANHCTLSVYADDVTISSERWDHFSAGFRKTVYRILGECGLKVNPAKCKVRRVSPLKVGSFDITGLAVDYDEHTGLPYVRPLHRRLTRRKAEYLDHLAVYGIEFTEELARDGTPKALSAVTAGLRGWADAKCERHASVQLALL